MNASTATATTVTADAANAGPTRANVQKNYVGRFAPSPTGALHLGSLVAAVGSFLDARKSGGRWLLRMEDLDTTRVIPGCSDEMLRTLEAFGLCWDGEVEYQSRRTALYANALQTLRERGLAYECSCSRRDIGSTESGYPGTCRARPRQNRGSTATRFRVSDTKVQVIDHIQGLCEFDLRVLGDPVIRRRDNVFAYQLAVVVDDAAQGVSHVVRGTDLLQSTAWQIQLQRALGLITPQFAHLPLICEKASEKLSKSRRALAIDPARASAQLCEALTLLNHAPPLEQQGAPPEELLAWASASWTLERLQGTREIVVSTQMFHV